MARPRDWYVLDLDDDPTPGEPVKVRQLARKARRTADNAEKAEREVRSLAGDRSVLEWVGAAADVFVDAIGEFPSKLSKVATSYEIASKALGSWADTLEQVQSDADRALERGRQARTQLDSLSGQLGAAQSAHTSASTTASGLTVPPPPGAPPPDPAQVQQAVRNAQQAASRLNALNGQIGAAKEELSFARRLALQAKEVREDAARKTAKRLESARKAAIKPDSFWHNLKEYAGKAWKVVVKVAKVIAAVVTVVMVVALIAAAVVILAPGLAVAGAVAAMAAAAASALAVAGAVAFAVLLIDTIIKYRKGEMSGWDVFWAAVDVIPFTKGIKALGKGVAALGKTGAKFVDDVGRVAVKGRDMAVKTAQEVAERLRRRADALRKRIQTEIRDVRRRPDDVPAKFRGVQKPHGSGSLFPPEYAPYGPGSEDEFYKKWWDFRRNRWIYPDEKDGFKDGFDGPAVPTTLKPGMVIDRFGPVGGHFASPLGTPYPQRALPPPTAAVNEYHRYRVVKPFPDGHVTQGKIAPHFDQPGGGVQYHFTQKDKDVKWYLDNGYLVDIDKLPGPVLWPPDHKALVK